MTIAQESESNEDIYQDVIFPPSDLYSDEPACETELHLRQLILLLESLEWLWKDRNDFYAMVNQTVYYCTKQLESRDLSSPDFFVALGCERKIRKSWVVWEEYGNYPNVVVEIMSELTAETDKGIKKEIYEDIYRAWDYFWFDPHTLEFAGFHIVYGKYEPLQANAQGHLWSQQLGLYLGIHQGLLRWFTPDGELVLTLEETTRQAQEKAERLAAKLRELNIDPDTI